MIKTHVIVKYKGYGLAGFLLLTLEEWETKKKQMNKFFEEMPKNCTNFFCGQAQTYPTKNQFLMDLDVTKITEEEFATFNKVLGCNRFGHKIYLAYLNDQAQLECFYQE
jgi:hypothetical protein